MGGDLQYMIHVVTQRLREDEIDFAITASGTPDSLEIRVPYGLQEELVLRECKMPLKPYLELTYRRGGMNNVLMGHLFDPELAHAIILVYVSQRRDQEALLVKALTNTKCEICGTETEEHTNELCFK